VKLQPIFQETLDDCRAVAKALNIDVKTADPGKTGLKTMYALFFIVCQNRSYADTHPNFVQGVWKRLLPYTGREYCWYYDKYQCNDTHVATLLKNVKQAMIA
jgi:hypothetical protein